jgi:hypothetical protein
MIPNGLLLHDYRTSFQPRILHPCLSQLSAALVVRRHPTTPRPPLHLLLNTQVPYVAGADLEQARVVARRIRAGWVAINDGFDFACPFGGYKKSGNGREWGEFGFHDYLEIKGILGYGEA